MDSYQTAQDVRDAITLIRCTVDHAAECDLQNQGEESLHCDMGTESSVMAEVANRLEGLLMVCELCGDERLLDDSEGRAPLRITSSCEEHHRL